MVSNALLNDSHDANWSHSCKQSTCKLDTEKLKITCAVSTLLTFNRICLQIQNQFYVVSFNIR